MGIPLWESPPTAALHKSSASSRCNLPADYAWSGDDDRHADWRDFIDDAPSSRPEPATTTSQPEAPSGPGGSGGGSGDDNTTLTLDEFLRETSQANVAGSQPDRQLQALLAIQRRQVRDDNPRNAWRDRSARSLFDTPTGRAFRPPLSPAAAFSLVSAVAPVTTTAVATSSTPTPAPRSRTTAAGSADSFETLVGQIRRIGALQDFMLSSVDATASSLEEPSSGSSALAENASRSRPGGSLTADRERNRRLMADLMDRQVRLREMQNRIDVLESEFALLRETNRELHRVESEALDALRNSRNSSTTESNEATAPERRGIRRAFLQQPESTSSPTAATTAVHVIGHRSTTSEEDRQRSRQALGVPPADSPAPPTPPRSTDRRANAMTRGERDRLLRNQIMRMQLDSLGAYDSRV